MSLDHAELWRKQKLTTTRKKVQESGSCFSFGVAVSKLRQSGDGKVDQWERVTATKPDDPSLMTRSHMVEGKN